MVFSTARRKRHGWSYSEISLTVLNTLSHSTSRFDFLVPGGGKMWAEIWLAVLGLAAGIAIGLNLPFTIPDAYARYISVAALAALDSVFVGISAAFEERFDNKIFITDFFSNALLAAGLAFTGEHLGIDLYLAGVVTFGVRLFQNLALIWRHLVFWVTDQLLHNSDGSGTKCKLRKSREV